MLEIGLGNPSPILLSNYRSIIMKNKEFFNALRDLQEAKNLDQDYIINAFELALTAACRKALGQGSAEVRLRPEDNTIRIFVNLTVVAEVEDDEKEISLQEAQEINPKYQIGDMVSRELEVKEFNRIAVQTIKQVMTQKIKEAERQEMLSNVAEKEGTLVTGIIKRIDGDNVYVDLNNALEGLLTERDCLPNDSFRVGERVKVYVRYIKSDVKSSVLQVTRANPGFVKKLFELEVPEIANGAISIVNIVREPGLRTKIAIKANDANIDAVGACIGNKGMRIAPIIQELGGEKIDIVPFSEDAREYICSALSPAQVIDVEIDETIKSAKVSVPENKLSLAIGRGGHNVRLAAKLTGWKLDVKAQALRTIEEQGVVSGANIILDDDDQDMFTDIDE